MSLLILLSGVLALLVKEENGEEVLIIALIIALIAFVIEIPVVMQLIAWEVI